MADGAVWSGGMDKRATSVHYGERQQFECAWQTRQGPNQIAPFHKMGSSGRRSRWFDTSAFLQPTTADYGKTPKNGYGPGLTKFDAPVAAAFRCMRPCSYKYARRCIQCAEHPNFANRSELTSKALASGGAANARPGMRARSAAVCATLSAEGECDGVRSIWSLNAPYRGRPGALRWYLSVAVM